MKTLYFALMLLLLAACRQESVDPQLPNIFTTNSSDEMFSNVGKLTVDRALILAGRGPDVVLPNPELGLSPGSYATIWNMENKTVRLIFDKEGVLENYDISWVVGDANWQGGH